MADHGRAGYLRWVSGVPDPTNPATRADSVLSHFCRGCFLKPANLIAESEVYMKNQDIKTGIYKVICFAAKNHNQSFSRPPHSSFCPPAHLTG